MRPLLAVPAIAAAHEVLVGWLSSRGVAEVLLARPDADPLGLVGLAALLALRAVVLLAVPPLLAGAVVWRLLGPRSPRASRLSEHTYT